MGRPVTPLAGRIWQKIETDPETGCWGWVGYVGKNGYGYLTVSRIIGTKLVHRLAYELFRGPIPEGLEIDHLCRNRRCANPAHLELVTRRENLMRGDTIARRCAEATHCIHGHEFSTENTWIDKLGTRHCRSCSRRNQRDWKRRQCEAIA